MVENVANNDSGCRFNRELARKIRDFDKDRDQLRNNLFNLVKDLFGKEPDWMPYICMDPFTCLSMLNRFYSVDNRKALAKKLAEFWDVHEEPDSFTSIPCVNNLSTAFVWGSKRPESDPDGIENSRYRSAVDTVWKCFRTFVDFPQGKCSEDEFVEAFDAVKHVKGFKTPKLTMGLSWIDYEFYISLDGPNMAYFKQDGIQPEVDIYKMTGRQYLDFIGMFKEYLRNNRMVYFDYSFEAWNRSHQKDKAVPWWPSEAEFRTQITKERWIELLHDSSVFDQGSLRLIKQILDHGGDSSFAELGQEYCCSPSTFISVAHHLAKRVQESTGCEYPNVKNATYWPIVFLGRYSNGKVGGEPYSYKVRDELKDAAEMCTELFEQIDLDEAVNKSGEPKMETKTHPLNQILYGPPGTGKTYNTAKYAVEIITGQSLEDPFDEYNRLCNEGRIGFVTFHQSYSYEEFIEGIRPDTEAGADGLSYKYVDGIFKEFCSNARNGSITTKPAGLNDSPTVWKVSLNGTGNNPIREDCLKNGYIRLGWHEYGEQLTEETVYEKGGKVVLDTFINKMNIGDLVISCYSNKTADAIGIVTGEYYYKAEGGEYPRYRDVEWISKFNEPVNILQINNGKVMTLMSVYKMDVSVPDVLDLAGYTGRTVSDKKYVFIIDEINRGNISRILGELITLLEPSKREGQKEALTVTLPCSKSRFSIPSNVYVLGTMNTADKSLVSLDAALRRRFRFREMMTDYSLLSENVSGVNVRRLLEVINERIEILYDRDHTIGHSYLMKVKSIEDLEAAFKEAIIPLLQEYFMDDFEKIGQVLARSGKTDADSMFVVKKDYATHYKGAPHSKFVLNEGLYTKEMFESIYTKQE